MKYADGVRLDGIHHVTCITADAPRNVEYYTGVLGLRLVKKSVNQDDPTVYHLFYADEDGTPGSDITFFEYPGRARGAGGRGDDPHRRLARRLGGGASSSGASGSARCRSSIRTGCGTTSSSRRVPDAPLIADHPEIPREMALQGFEGVRAYGEEPTAFLEALGFEDGLDARRFAAGLDPVRAGARRAAGIGGSGTVHHVAWACELGEQEAWRERVEAAGGHPTPVIDRFWFRSIYFREPTGVLFEIATLGPGLRRGRGSGAPRRDAHPPAELRAPPLAGRAAPHAAPEDALAVQSDTSAPTVPDTSAVDSSHRASAHHPYRSASCSE